MDVETEKVPDTLAAGIKATGGEGEAKATPHDDRERANRIPIWVVEKDIGDGLPTERTYSHSSLGPPVGYVVMPAEMYAYRYAEYIRFYAVPPKPGAYSVVLACLSTRRAVEAAIAGEFGLSWRPGESPASPSDPGGARALGPPPGGIGEGLGREPAPRPEPATQPRDTRDTLALADVAAMDESARAYYANLGKMAVDRIEEALDDGLLDGGPKDHVANVAYLIPDGLDALIALARRNRGGGAGAGQGEPEPKAGDDSTPTPEQDIQSYRARLESEGHRTVAAKHYRSVLNRVANSVGAVPIALGEMGVEHIAEGAESLSRYRDQLEETNSALTADRTGMAAWAASHEHHEEHHQRERELEAEIEGLRAERDAFRSLCLSLSECYRPQDILGSHTWPGYERAEALMREHLGLPALPADTLADTPASGGEGGV